MLIREIENWPAVFFFYSIPRPSGKILQIHFRSGMELKVPSDYIFEPLAETLLQNVYGFSSLPHGAVIVDIGASIGDFALIASRSRGSRVYAFEPNPYIFSFLTENIRSNGVDPHRIFNSSATGDTLRWILEDCGESRIDFLKIDCDGCEYDLILRCPLEVLSKIRTIAMEIHPSKSHRKEEVIARLKATGFTVVQRRLRGEGHYVRGIQPS